MRILLDVMGGDHPSQELIKGGVAIGRRRSIDVVFAGDPREIERALSDAGEKPGKRFDVLPSAQTIRMEDAPVKAVREKTDSSLVLGLNALKRGEVDAFVSPGNTGAVVAGSVFIVGDLNCLYHVTSLGRTTSAGNGQIVIIGIGGFDSKRKFFILSYFYFFRCIFPNRTTIDTQDGYVPDIFNLEFTVRSCKGQAVFTGVIKRRLPIEYTCTVFVIGEFPTFR